MSAVARSPVEDAPPPKPRRSWRWLWWFSPLIAIGLFFALLVPTMCRPR